MRAGDVLGHEFMGDGRRGRPRRDEAPGGRPRGGGAPSSAAGSAGTASRGCGRCATTATPTRGSPRRCGARPSAAATGTRTPSAAGRAATRPTSGCPYADQGAFADPRRRLRRAGAVRLRRRARPAGRARTRPGCRPGDVVAVWGAGGVGQMAARAAMLHGRRAGRRHRPVRQPARAGPHAHRGGDPRLRARSTSPPSCGR